MDTENQHQEPESASAMLVDGMHFAGAIDDFRIDLDAEVSVGGAGVGPPAAPPPSAGHGRLHGDGCYLDPAQKAPTGEWPPC